MDSTFSKQVCIVGGGNAAHALAALLPSRGVRTVWYAPYANEAKKINEGLRQHGVISATFAAHNDPSGLVQVIPNYWGKRNGINAAEIPIVALLKPLN